jgi:hypothetical protein
MLVLASTSDLLRVVTTSTADTKVHATWCDLVDAATTATPNRTNTTSITSATTTTVVGSPGCLDQAVHQLPEYPEQARLDLADGHRAPVGRDAGARDHPRCPLAAGECLTISNNGTMYVYDVNGGVKSAVSIAASDTASGVIELAVQSEMETGTDVVRAVTPGRQQYHASASKAWLSCGVTANILGSYNITSLTDTGTGDVAVTINVDFSGASTYAWLVSVQRTNSTAAAANARCGTIKTATLAAGTVSADCWDDTATTNVISDPTTWHMAGFGDLP